jgi:hypothetical protein
MYLVEFSIFLSYTHALHFEDKPDYNYICKLFHDFFLCERYYHNRLFVRCAMGDNQRAIVGQDTSNEWRVEQENSTQYTSGKMYIAHSSTHTLLITTYLVYVLIAVTLNTT